MTIFFLFAQKDRPTGLSKLFKILIVVEIIREISDNYKFKLKPMQDPLYLSKQNY